jgi:hypothetical protein
MLRRRTSSGLDPIRETPFNSSWRKKDVLAVLKAVANR